jgi:hypothetical protein
MRKELATETKASKTPAEPAELRPDELHEADLDEVTGGRKAGKEQQEFLTVTMKDVLITSTP